MSWAVGPFRPGATPKAALKPKPLAALSHFTVPDAMPYLLWGSTRARTRGTRMPVRRNDTPPGMTGNKKRFQRLKIPFEALEVREPSLQLKSTVARHDSR